MKSFGSAGRLMMLAAVVAFVAAACIPPKPPGPTIPPGSTIPPAEAEDAFLSFPMIEGLTAGLNVEFAPDGRVFVAEKAGIIKTYDSIDDPTPTITADINVAVRNVGDHGLLGLAVDPAYPVRPYLYVLYTWDSTGFWGDACNAGYSTNGCVTGGRIARIEVDANAQMVGSPTTLVDDRWCMQFSSHGVGDLNFLDDGTLIASAGEGAYWAGADYGQYGGQQFIPPRPNVTPKNPCGDPPVNIGQSQAGSTSQGGSFRAQDVLTEGDPVTWSGSVVRIDPDTGAAPADNPLVGIGSPDDDHVIAHGLRNPYRFTTRPGTNEVFTVDVGYARFEEINKITVGEHTKNFGWPCMEGPGELAVFAALNNSMCALAESPEARTDLTDPWFAYSRLGGGAITSIAYLGENTRYPERYDDSLIFSDYVLGTTWSLGLDADGTPSDEGPRPVMSNGVIVDLETGPDGYLYAVDYVNGSVNRLVDKDAAPVARLTASATDGAVPLTVNLDASASTQSGGGALTFLWDLDGDGEFNDAAGATTSITITEAANREVSVKVTNVDNASAVASTTIYAGNTAPTVSIDVTSPLPWAAGDDVTFAITATDAEDGPVPAASVSWEAEIHHCYEAEDCHVHPYTDQTGSTGATVEGPSHGFPSFLMLVATATDSRGQTTRVTQDLHPATVTLGVTSSPSGARIAIGEEQLTTPFSYTAIKNDSVSLAAPTPQTIGGNSYVFSAWGHGGGQAQQYAATADANLNLVMTPGP